MKNILINIIILTFLTSCSTSLTPEIAKINVPESLMKEPQKLQTIKREKDE